MEGYPYEIFTSECEHGTRDFIAPCFMTGSRGWHLRVRSIDIQCEPPPQDLIDAFGPEPFLQIADNPNGMASVSVGNPVTGQKYVAYVPFDVLVRAIEWVSQAERKEVDADG